MGGRVCVCGREVDLLLGQLTAVAADDDAAVYLFIVGEVGRDRDGQWIESRWIEDRRIVQIQSCKESARVRRLERYRGD